MRKIRLCLCTMIAIAALISALPIPAFADSYQVLALSNDAEAYIYGMYSSGAVVLVNPGYSFGNCATYVYEDCYITYVNGLPFSGSNTPPSIPPGSGGSIGGSCPSVPSNVPSSALLFSFCTDGDVVYGNDRYDNPDGSIAAGGIFSSDGSTIVYIGGDIPWSRNLSIDSYGDIVWDDIGYEEIFEAYDVTTHLGEVPEPSSWTFIVIGMLIATAVIRKREFC